MKLQSFSVNSMPIERKEFIDLYSNDYFLDKDKYTVKRISRSCEWIEKDITCLLTKTDWSDADIVHMLAWKMGRINHKDSKYPNYIFTGNGWNDGQNGECLAANNRKGKIDIGYLVQNIHSFKKDYADNKETYDDNPENLLTRLREVLNVNGEQTITGVGSVYLITILYFVSGGYYPIYDQFAMKAIEALDEGAVPGCNIPLRSLPDKNENAFLKLLTRQKADSIKGDSAYLKYIRLLEKYFYDEEINFRKPEDGRKVDQALWVYGHRFY
ncbi:MAG: hypothetical protein IKD89_06990 [Clostridia bacterium]|nr:hypothetical protein [Clostridia bacterium]